MTEEELKSAVGEKAMRAIAIGEELLVALNLNAPDSLLHEKMKEMDVVISELGDLVGERASGAKEAFRSIMQDPMKMMRLWGFVQSKENEQA